MIAWDDCGELETLTTTTGWSRGYRHNLGSMDLNLLRLLVPAVCWNCALLVGWLVGDIWGLPVAGLGYFWHATWNSKNSPCRSLWLWTSRQTPFKRAERHLLNLGKPAKTEIQILHLSIISIISIWSQWGSFKICVPGSSLPVQNGQTTTCANFRAPPIFGGTSYNIVWEMNT